jgi:hypothetical protein
MGALEYTGQPCKLLSGSPKGNQSLTFMQVDWVLFLRAADRQKS